MIAKLAQLVEREADYLLGMPAGLSKDELEALGVLCRCAHALKLEDHAPDAPEGDTGEDLALVDKVG